MIKEIEGFKESDFPVGVDCPVRYSKNIKALIGYLNDRHCLPFNRLQEMLIDLFAMLISINIPLMTNFKFSLDCKFINY